MIEGLHFDIQSTELSEILQTRIDQATKKADLYDEQAKKQAELTKEMGKEIEDMPKMSSDQSSNLDKKAHEYRQKAKEYKFLKEHLIKDEVYRLTRQELNFLGITKDRYY